MMGKTVEIYIDHGRTFNQINLENPIDLSKLKL